MLTTGLFFHLVSLFADNGLSPDRAASAFIPIALTTAITTLLSGILVDRVPVKVLLFVALLCQAVSLLMATHLQGPAWTYVYGVFLGTTSGLVRTVNSVAWAAYFGRLHLGSITGVATTLLIAGSALGPMPFGMARDWWGSYDGLLYGSAVLPLALGIACLFIKKPKLTEHRAR
jgi:predicted MFS family arabinose efflux permease